MPKRIEYDVVVVGSGPNGLAAAITMARAGRSVLVLEGKDTIGGGTRTQELTLPGLLHDVCSAIHPIGAVSPFFQSLPLEQYGLEWIHPPYPLAHPLDDGTAVVMERSVQATAARLGADGPAYHRLIEPVVADLDKILMEFLGPFPLPPKHPLADARFGLKALRSGRALVESYFKGQKARALFGGIAAHAIMPLEKIISASFGLILGSIGHAYGWPIVRGGSQHITGAMAAYLQAMGGEIVTGQWVHSMEELPTSRTVFFDLTPRQLLKIAGHRMPSGYRSQLERFRYGPGVFKIDWALSEPIPWKAAECRQAGTVHAAGTFEELSASERSAWQDQICDRPFVLVAQQSLFDSERTRDGMHTGWAYCHVPNGSTVDMTERIEAQIERFAPGFRDCIVARVSKSPAEMEAYSPNYIGGDINGGAQDVFQLFTRPILSLQPYATPIKGVYICSSSTPPGGAVHGMCGYNAASMALRQGG